MTTKIPEKTQSEESSDDARLMNDYTYYAETFLKIIDKQAHRVPFHRNAVQKMTDEMIDDIKARGHLVRVYNLKGRQFGVSTDRLGRNYHRTSTQANKTALFVAHEPGAKTRLFEILRLMYDSIPDYLPEWKPQLKKNNVKELAFAGLNSVIKVGCAEEENTGSGQTINYLHLSELPKYPKNKVSSLLTSLFQAVPDSDPDSEIFIEGTAYGMGGEFYDGFWGARYVYEGYLLNGKPAWKMSINPDSDAQNNWASIFLPWFIHDEYEMEPEPGFTRTTENHPVYGNETEIAKLYGLNECKLQWRRWAIYNKCRGSKEIFAQEYATTARGAFLSSGRPVFDPTDAVEKRRVELEHLRRTKKETVTLYSCQLSTGQWIASSGANGTDGLLQVFTEYQPGVSYVVSADVSEGLEGGDWDAAEVQEQITGKQVAVWHGHMAPDLFGILLAHLGTRYGMALVAPERNNHGLTTVIKLVSDRSEGGMNYPNVYVETVPDPPGKPRKRYGWYTGSGHSNGKMAIIDAMSADFRDHPENIRDLGTINEMLTYKHNSDGTMGAEAGRFDDRIIARAIGNFVRKRMALPSTGSAPIPQRGPAGPPRPTSGPSANGYT